MQAFPHTYTATSAAGVSGDLTCSADNLPNMSVAPPIQFGGDGVRWSPEDLLMASISSCFILSFRAIATASKFEWHAIECVSEGVLDKVDRTIKFTRVVNRAKLIVPSSVDKAAAERMLMKAERACLISNSLSCEMHLECEIGHS